MTAGPDCRERKDVTHGSVVVFLNLLEVLGGVYHGGVHLAKPVTCIESPSFTFSCWRQNRNCHVAPGDKKYTALITVPGTF